MNDLAITEPQDAPVTSRIIAAAIEVHRIPGPGLLESIYEESLCIELTIRKIPFERQVPVPVHDKQHVIRGQRIDLLADGVIVEIKAVGQVPDIAVAQVLSYLKATRLERALLINFNAKRSIIGVRR